MCNHYALRRNRNDSFDQKFDTNQDRPDYWDSAVRSARMHPFGNNVIDTCIVLQLSWDDNKILKKIVPRTTIWVNWMFWGSFFIVFKKIDGTIRSGQKYEDESFVVF